MPRPYTVHPLEAVLTRRQLLQISATRIAEALGLETPSYRRVERGERRCYLDKAFTIAEILGCSIVELGIMPDAEERKRLFAIGDAKSAATHMTPEQEMAALLAKHPGPVPPADDEDDDDDDGYTTPAVEVLRPEAAIPASVKVLNSLPDTQETEQSLAAMLAAFGPDDDSPYVPDPGQNDLVVLGHEGVTSGSVEDDDEDEPALLADPMSKYVSTWSGDA